MIIVVIKLVLNIYFCCSELRMILSSTTHITWALSTRWPANFYKNAGQS